MTCGACPEQYDAYKGTDKIGYLRLRHGVFRVEYRGVTIFTGHPRGDGIFEEHERPTFLATAAGLLEVRYAVEQEGLTTTSPKYVVEDSY